MRAPGAVIDDVCHKCVSFFRDDYIIARRGSGRPYVLGQIVQSLGKKYEGDMKGVVALNGSCGLLGYYRLKPVSASLARSVLQNEDDQAYEAEVVAQADTDEWLMHIAFTSGK